MAELLTVVLGAGSSFDCADPSVTSVDPVFKPPLVKDLFDSRQPFNEILAQYPSVESIAEDLRTKLKRPDTNLEELLRDLASKGNISRRRQYWEVPLYFQHLLSQVSSKYVISGSTKFHTLVNAILDSSYERVLFITLNYDLFLEKALTQSAGVQFSSLGSYGQKESRWCVVKLHGSVNWGRRLQNQPQGKNSWSYILQNLMEPPKLEEEITMLQDFREDRPGLFHSGRFVNGTFHYPALGIPVEGKDRFFCPKEHIETARQLIRECRDFLIIGFSANDAHVLELFEPVQQIHKLAIVNGRRDSGLEALGLLSPKVPAIQNQWQRDWKSYCYDGGFLNFTYNRAHEIFLGTAKP